MNGNTGGKLLSFQQLKKRLFMYFEWLIVIIKFPFGFTFQKTYLRT